MQNERARHRSGSRQVRIACGAGRSTLLTVLSLSRDFSLPPKFGLSQAEVPCRERYPCAPDEGVRFRFVPEGRCDSSRGLQPPDIDATNTLYHVSRPEGTRSNRSDRVARRWHERSAQHSVARYQTRLITASLQDATKQDEDGDAMGTPPLKCRATVTASRWDAKGPNSSRRLQPAAHGRLI